MSLMGDFAALTVFIRGWLGNCFQPIMLPMFRRLCPIQDAGRKHVTQR